MRRSTAGSYSPALSCLFRQALELAGVGLSGAALAGCGAEMDSEGYLITHTASGTVANKADFVEVECEEQPLFLGDLTSAVPVDAIELWDTAPRERAGVPCDEAERPSDCRGRYSELSTLPGFPLGQSGQFGLVYHLRATRGDEILRIGTVGELLEFLAPIDSAGDAQLLVATRGYAFVCGLSGTRPVADGNEVLAFTYAGCDGRTRYLLHVGLDGIISTVDRFVERKPDPNCSVGRRPEGLRQSAGDPCASLGSFFAHSAALEAASVPAFLQLARELRAHGAPPALARRALAAARDEVRHTRAVDALARAFGAQTPPFRVPPAAVRGLEAVAVDNGIEGCVRETYGALVAHHQARRARDPRVRAVYRRIAADETRHAELSWAVARWSEARLTDAERRRVQAARSFAATELVAQLRSSEATQHGALAGLPSPRVGAALAAQLDRSLWRRSAGG